MGYGHWEEREYSTYSTSMGRKVTSEGTLHSSYKAQDLFKSRVLQPELDPYEAVRECCDSAEHPKTIPVILALDVTGSMGAAAAEVAKKLNEVMTNLYNKVRDVEFLVMGIGDLEAYDKAPIQASQFESDIRIAKQLDKIYFEGGGGNNEYESYTAAWYFGLYHTKLDCWKRGKKGIIITMGDEPLNPILYKDDLEDKLGDILQSDIDTKDLYSRVSEKFNLYHLAVEDKETNCVWWRREIKQTFGQYFDENHLKFVTLDDISKTIVDIVTSNADELRKEIIDNDIISSDIAKKVANMADKKEEQKEVNTIFGSMKEFTW